jgi:ATP-dependent phosphofructokinase / diphosphate-dependent phosphofructokinase
VLTTAGTPDFSAGTGMAARGVGAALSDAIEQRTGFESRVTVLGHLQRGAAPSVADRFWATRLGAKAVDLIIEDAYGTASVRHGELVEAAPLARVLEEHRGVPKELYQMTSPFGYPRPAGEDPRRQTPSRRRR